MSKSKSEVEIKTISIEDIKPYWKNPRKNEEAVEKVKESIEQYGYNNPIVVDTSNIIIAGHTRFKALKKLGVKEVDCVVKDMSEEEAKQYRIVDNKTQEYAEWDETALKYELTSMDDIEEIDMYFEDDELDELLDGMIMDGDELDEIAEEDFDIDYSSVEKSIEEGTDTQEGATDSAPINDEAVEEAREERRKRLEEQRKKQKEKLNKAKEEHENQFKEKSEEAQNDYVDLTCPHCEEKFTISLAELKRKIRYKENGTFS